MAFLAVAACGFVSAAKPARANTSQTLSDPESPSALNASIPPPNEGHGESRPSVTIGDSHGATPLSLPARDKSDEAPPTRLRIEFGPSMVRLGGARLSRPTSMFIAAGWERHVRGGGLQVDAGLRIRSIRLTYSRVQDGLESESLVSTLVGTVRFHRRLSLAVDVGAWWGAGIGVWTGLGDQNPFSVSGQAPSSTVVLPTLETGIELSYRRPGSRFELVASVGAAGASVTGKQLWEATPWLASLNLGVGLAWSF